MKNCRKSFFIIEKILKYRKCPAPRSSAAMVMINLFLMVKSLQHCHGEIKIQE